MDLHRHGKLDKKNQVRSLTQRPLVELTNAASVVLLSAVVVFCCALCVVLFVSATSKEGTEVASSLSIAGAFQLLQLCV